MQKRGFLVLAAATLVLVVLAIVSLTHGDRATVTADVNRLALPELGTKLHDLAWIRLSHGAGKTDFAEVNGQWTIVEKGSYPAAAGKVRQMLLALANLTLVEPKTERPDLFARLGLDDPKNGHSTLVTLQDRTGATLAELIVGRQRIDRFGGGEDGVYVRRPNENRAWLARGSLDLAGETIEWLDRRILDIPQQRIAAVVLTDESGAALTLKRAAADAPFAVEDAPKDAKLKPPPMLAESAGALHDLELLDVKPAADLAMPDQGTAKAVYTTFDGLSVTLHLQRRDNAEWAAITASGDGPVAAESKTINDRLGRWAYAIPESQAKVMRRKLADLVEPPKGS
jgi:hypothetical protein